MNKKGDKLVVEFGERLFAGTVKSANKNKFELILDEPMSVEKYLGHPHRWIKKGVIKRIIFKDLPVKDRLKVSKVD